MTILKYYHVMYVGSVILREYGFSTKPFGVLYRDKLLRDIKRKND